ncbi:MAG TPA: hypothetical protein VFA49_14375 [Chloroflexota bacterium]|nr:hypothetical protein [Chloroflexota bacterium]
MQKELTLQEFYASDPRRAHSHEVRYGSLWRAFAPVPAYRLAWVEITGELYTVELSEADERRDPVEVLGVLWSWPQVEACLAGWRERCGEQRSLLWARERVRTWRPVVEESQFLQDRPWVQEEPAAEQAAAEGRASRSGRARLAGRLLKTVGRLRRQR